MTSAMTAGASHCYAAKASGSAGADWRDGSGADELKQMPPGNMFEYPRWSPDDRWIACQYSGPYGGLDVRLLVVGVADGEPQDVVRGTSLRGLAWLQDGSGIVYSSSAGSTVLYPPILNLRAVHRDGGGDRQLTFGDVSYVEPDVHVSGLLAASRIRMQSDIWKFPVTGSPAENTRSAVSHYPSDGAGTNSVGEPG